MFYFNLKIYYKFNLHVFFFKVYISMTIRLYQRTYLHVRNMSYPLILYADFTNSRYKTEESYSGHLCKVSTF